jgi:Fic family protein
MRLQLKSQELAIIKALLENPYYISTTGVSKLAKVSWNTALKYLNAAYSKNWIAKAQRGNRTYWRAYRKDV